MQLWILLSLCVIRAIGSSPISSYQGNVTRSTWIPQQAFDAPEAAGELIHQLYDGCFWYDDAGRNLSEAQAYTAPYNESSGNICVTALLGYMLKEMVSTPSQYVSLATSGWEGVHESTQSGIDYYLPTGSTYFEFSKVFGVKIQSKRVGKWTSPGEFLDMLNLAQQIAGDKTNETDALGPGPVPAVFRASDYWLFSICASNTSETVYWGKITVEAFNVSMTYEDIEEDSGWDDILHNCQDQIQ
ncbi:hypothetical protein LTR86_010975 [Recurvomyces mirabilis]|nr:hypothetical protein LTR86_010975 [Recurvomyces mirabilis]